MTGKSRKCSSQTAWKPWLNRHYLLETYVTICLEMFSDDALIWSSIIGKENWNPVEKQALLHRRQIWRIKNKACPNMHCTAPFLETMHTYYIYSFIYSGDAILAAKCRLLLYLECGKYMSLGLLRRGCDITASKHLLYMATS